MMAAITAMVTYPLAQPETVTRRIKDGLTERYQLTSLTTYSGVFKAVQKICSERYPKVRDRSILISSVLAAWMFSGSELKRKISFQQPPTPEQIRVIYQQMAWANLETSVLCTIIGGEITHFEAQFYKQSDSSCEDPERLSYILQMKAFLELLQKVQEAFDKHLLSLRDRGNNLIFWEDNKREMVSSDGWKPCAGWYDYAKLDTLTEQDSLDKEGYTPFLEAARSEEERPDTPRSSEELAAELDSLPPSQLPALLPSHPVDPRKVAMLLASEDDSPRVFAKPDLSSRRQFPVLFTAALGSKSSTKRI